MTAGLRYEREGAGEVFIGAKTTYKTEKKQEAAGAGGVYTSDFP